MVDPSSLSRRERQIMDIFFARGEATVRQIQELLDDPPTVMAIRRMLQIREEKGHLKRRQEGSEVAIKNSGLRREVSQKVESRIHSLYYEKSMTHTWRSDNPEYASFV